MINSYGVKEQLKREIGLFGLSANLINIMVGAGIFALPAIIAAGLGSASIFAYLFCGLLLAFVMLCFAEVGSKITTSGGAYSYIQTSFGSYFGFLTSILFVLSAIAADAAVANAIVDILGSIFPIFQNKIVVVIFLLILFAGLGYINVVGIKESIGFVKIITIAKLVPLLAIVIFSWGKVSTEYLSIDSIPSLKSIGETSLILFFAFQGAESGLSVSGEVRNPSKIIPRAIFISVLGVLVLYIFIQIVSQGVLGQSLPNYSENPLGEVSNRVFGSKGLILITIGALVSMLGYLSSELLSMPRVLFRASKDKVLPIKRLSNVHDKFSTPFVSIITYAVVGFIFAVSGGFKQLAIISSASILLVYLGVSFSVLKLRRMKITGNEKAGFKIPGGYIIPVLSSLTIVWLLTNMNYIEAVVIGSFIAVLTIVYYLKSRFKTSE